MTSVFSAIGAAFKKLIGTDADPVDKVDLMGKYDLLHGTVLKLRDAYGCAPIRTYLVEAARADGTPFKKIYEQYLRGANSTVNSMERNGPLSSIHAALTILERDCTEIQQKLTTFGSADSSSIDVASLRISDAAVLGYYDRGILLCRWAATMLNIAVNSVARIAIPPYQPDWCLSNTAPVESFVMSVVNRGGSFMAAIESMRRAGHDVALQTNGVTLDQYVRDSDYNNVINTAMSGFIPSPFMFIGKRRIEKERAQIEELKATRNWLTAKIGLMTLDQARSDPNSAEYARQQKILSNYQRDLADADKELNGYA